MNKIIFLRYYKYIIDILNALLVKKIYIYKNQ